MDVLIKNHKEFQDLTGITVGAEQIPEQQARQKQVLEFQSGQTSFDIAHYSYHVHKRMFAKNKWTEDHRTYLNDPTMTPADFDWNDFSTLFFFNPESYYLYGLDPTFMEVWYPDALAKLERMRSGRAVLEPAFFRQQFGASWLVVPKHRSREVRACFDSGMEPAFEDDDAVIFGIPE